MDEPFDLNKDTPEKKINNTPPESAETQQISGDTPPVDRSPETEYINQSGVRTVSGDTPPPVGLSPETEDINQPGVRTVSGDTPPVGRNPEAEYINQSGVRTVSGDTPPVGRSPETEDINQSGVRTVSGDTPPVGRSPETEDINQSGVRTVSGDTPPPSVVSLEGRKVELEKKISEEIERQPDAARPDAVYGAAYPAADQSKLPISNGAKAYIILISGLVVVFLIAFILECSRAYSENGIFGGGLDRFIDTDFSAYDPFSDDDKADEKDKDSDEKKNPFSGLLPFDFDDSDVPFDFSDSDEAEETDHDKPSAPADSGIKAAPDAESVLDLYSADLEVNDQPGDIDTAEYTAAKAYKKVSDSVVNVVVYSSADKIGDSNYKSGTGSGIIATKNGYIITNSHVIEDSKDTGVEIITTSGEHYAATTVGFDTRTDLAVVKIDAEDLKPVEFVNSDQLEVGQDAIAVGNPGGVAYSNSLTKGCVSALNRTVPSNTLVSYIQTDAAINPGNSGGPLLNSAGQVMGITTIKIASTDYEGMGFAIPSNTTIEIANSLIAEGFVEGRVRLGIIGSVYMAGAADDITGIKVEAVQSDSPLKATEIKDGDVITAINGVSVPDFTTLYSQLGKYSPGDKVKLSIYRPPTPGDAGKEFEVEIELLADTGDALPE